MSEYQYYEFLAIDRPLSGREMGELRAVSTRAAITSTSFVNYYHWGDFKGNPSRWMEKYFDAFLYLANWGTHWLMFRFPRRSLELAIARLYCPGESATARAKGNFIILEFRSENEDGEWDEGSAGRLTPLVPLRADIASGDHRALYLAWLLGVQEGEVDEEALEPPCPPGLGKLPVPLEAFADFLRIDRDLIEAAAAGSSPAADSPSGRELKRWIYGLPEDEKNALLSRLAVEEETHVKADVIRRLRLACRNAQKAPAISMRRGAGELLEAAKRIAERRRRRKAGREAREQARRERKEAALRVARLRALEKREPQAWEQVDELIASRRPGDYDQAVQLLKDLKDVGLRTGRAGEVDARVRRLRHLHASKRTLVERLARAGLVSFPEAGR